MARPNLVPPIYGEIGWMGRSFKKRSNRNTYEVSH